MSDRIPAGVSAEDRARLAEASRKAEQFLTCLDLLYLGPVDYNIEAAADCLRVALRMMEALDRRPPRETAP